MTAELTARLDEILREFDCVTGTIHGLDPDSELLTLRAHRGIPDALRERIETIPVGKGMAGLAAERGEPVQVCSLQTDASGAAKPAARDTGMAGAISVPILVEGMLRGTLGIAKPVAYEFTAEETERLSNAASALGNDL